MIPRDKMLELLKGLQEKSRRREVVWTIDDELQAPDHGLYVAFPNSTFYFRFVSPVAEFDRFEVEIENRDRRILGSAHVEEEDRDWGWVATLFDELDRALTGSDRVLSEIESAIQSNARIGVKTIDSI